MRTWLADVKIPSPLSCYIGGKSILASRLISFFPDHTLYCEPFCGSAAVFFRKKKSAIEVLNDKNKEIITLFRVLRDQRGAFDNYLKYCVASRDEFSTLLHTDPETLDPVARAWRFLYIMKCGMGGKILCASYGYHVTTSDHMIHHKIRYFEKFIDVYIKRLHHVNIECEDYIDNINRYDAITSFFYIDPPYIGSQDYYGKDMDFNDWEILADKLKNIKGKFMLSINDCDEAKRIFGDFYVTNVKTKYSCNDVKTSDAHELVFTNYKINKLNKQHGLFGD